MHDYKQPTQLSIEQAYQILSIWFKVEDKDFIFISYIGGKSPQAYLEYVILGWEGFRYLEPGLSAQQECK